MSLTMKFFSFTDLLLRHALEVLDDPARLDSREVDFAHSELVLVLARRAAARTRRKMGRMVQAFGMGLPEGMAK